MRRWTLVVKKAMPLLFLPLVIIACGPSTEEISRASTLVAENEKATQDILAATREFNQAATATAQALLDEKATATTQALQIQNVDSYFPHERDTVWWYSVTTDGDTAGVTSFAVVGTRKINGQELLMLENYDSTFQFRNIDYLDIGPNGIDLILLEQSDIAFSESTFLSYSPPLPLLRFPLQQTPTFSYQSNVTDYGFDVVTSIIDSIEVPLGVFNDCYKTTRTTDEGIVDFAEVFCEDIGRVYIEHNFTGQTSILELIFMMNGRVDIKEIRVAEDKCEVEFDLSGFSPHDLITFDIQPPDLPRQTMLEEVPVSHFVYPFFPQNPTGIWIWYFAGTDGTTAIFPIFWSGECVELKRISTAQEGEAIEILDEAISLAVTGATSEALEGISQAYLTFPALEPTASQFNDMCWYGSIWGVVEQVYDYCELAVAASPRNASYRDSLGLANALLGNFDMAIIDFEFTVSEWSRYGVNSGLLPEREQWLAELKDGNNPFTEEVLIGLRPEQ